MVEQGNRFGSKFDTWSELLFDFLCVTNAHCMARIAFRVRRHEKRACKRQSGGPAPPAVPSTFLR
jgi:hypothetical protein